MCNSNARAISFRAIERGRVTCHRGRFAAPHLTLKSSSLFIIGMMLLAVVEFNPLLNATLPEAQRLLASHTTSSGGRSQSDQGGQTASPNPGGTEQEERVRKVLAQQYDQRFGSSDEAIRAALELKGKVADFVGYNAKQNRWLIAESKGSNIGEAFDQIANTTQGLLNKVPRARFELRIYVSTDHLSFLRDGGNFGGYYVDGQDCLRFLGDLRKWEYATVEGIKVLLHATP